MDSVKEHEIDEHIEVKESVPEHQERKPSAEFERNRKKLIQDGHTCYICGCNEGLEAHHYFAEWCLASEIDYDKLKEESERFDIHGYSSKMKDIPINSVDDIRNLMLLCKKHHTASLTGIHETVHPVWIAQKLVKNGTKVI